MPPNPHDVVVFEGYRSNTNIFHNSYGHYYHLNSTQRSGWYFQCIHRHSGCFGRAAYNRDLGFRVTQAHTYARDYQFADVRELRRRILQEAESNPYTTFRDIVTNEGQWFPMEVRSQLNSNMLRASMKRARMRMYPQVPVTLRDLADTLGDPDYVFVSAIEENSDNLFASAFEADDGSFHILFMSVQMSRYMELARWRFVDGHFASRPLVPETAQVFNFVTVIDNHTVWLGCALMESKSQAAYEALGATLKMLMPHLNPQDIVCDFEVRQQNAWLFTFPLAIIVGCLWHFCRAVVRKALSLGLGFWLRRSRMIRRLLRMCCSLPLLPPHLVVCGLFEIAIECWRLGRFMFELFAPLLDYLYVYWINHATRRESLSVFGSIHRTNNACECVNRWMKHEVGAHHPDIFSFLGALVTMEGISRCTLATLNSGGQPSRPRGTSAVNNDARVQMLTRQLFLRPLGLRHAIRTFIFYASNTVRGAFNYLIDRPGD